MIKNRVEGECRVEELVLSTNRNQGDVILQKRYDKNGFLKVDSMLSNGERHGVVKIYSVFPSGAAEVDRSVWFRDRPIFHVERVSSQEKYVSELEDFFLKEAMLEANYENPFCNDVRLLLPLLKKADNLDDCLLDLATNGLDSKLFQEVCIFPYDNDFTLDFYTANFVAFENSCFDFSEAGHIYMEVCKTFPDIIVSEALKQTASELRENLSKQLLTTLEIYVPALDDESLALLLATHRNEIKDRVEYEYKHRQNISRGKGFTHSKRQHQSHHN